MSSMDLYTSDGRPVPCLDSEWLQFGDTDVSESEGQTQLFEENIANECDREYIKKAQDKISGH